MNKNCSLLFLWNTVIELLKTFEFKVKKPSEEGGVHVDSIFMIQLESLQFKKLFETNMMSSCPFESVNVAGNSMP